MSDSITFTDGESCVRVAEGGKERLAPLLELTATGARIGAGVTINPGSYVDCVLAIKGHEPRQMFANVIEHTAVGGQLRWMFFEAGDEEAFGKHIAVLRGATTAPAQGTRRVIRATGAQRSLVDNTPAATPISPVTTSVESTAASETATSARTRRVVKPSSSRLEAPAIQVGHGIPTGAVDSGPATSAETHSTAAKAQTGEESGLQRVPVALAGTDRFSNLTDLDAEEKTGETTAPTVGADGRMDVTAALKSRAKTVRASELAARHDKVRVVNFSTIKALITEAVEEAAGHLTRSLGEIERKRLIEEAEEGFQERMKAFEAGKLSAEARSAQLGEQLHSAQQLLDDERKRAVSASQFTVSAAGLEALDDQFRRSLDRAINGKGITPELEEQLRALVARVLDSEREQMRARELEAQNAAIALLEKKIGRMSASLEEAERQRDQAREFAAMVEASGGGSVDLQKFKAGISGDEASRRRKLELMKELADQNRELRRALGIKLMVASEVRSEQLLAESEPKSEPKSEIKSEIKSQLIPPAPTAVAAELTRPPAAPHAVSTTTEVAAEPIALTPIAEEPLANPDDAPWQAEADAAAEAINPDDLPWEAPATPVAAATFKRPGAG